MPENNKTQDALDETAKIWVGKIRDAIFAMSADELTALIEKVKKGYWMGRSFSGYISNRSEDFNTLLKGIQCTAENAELVIMKAFNDFLSVGSYKSNSANTRLFLELLYAANHREKETDAVDLLSLIKRLKTPFSFAFRVQEHEYITLVNKKQEISRAREIRALQEDLKRHEKYAALQPILETLHLFQNEEEASWAIKGLDTTQGKMVFSLRQSPDGRHNILWHDVLGQPHLTSGRMPASQQPLDMSAARLLIASDYQKLIESIHPDIYIFSTIEEAKKFACAHPETMSFRLSYDSPLKKDSTAESRNPAGSLDLALKPQDVKPPVPESLKQWRLAWYSSSGKINYPSVTERLALLLRGYSHTLHLKGELEKEGAVLQKGQLYVDIDNQFLHFSVLSEDCKTKIDNKISLVELDCPLQTLKSANELQPFLETILLKLQAKGYIKRESLAMRAAQNWFRTNPGESLPVGGAIYAELKATLSEYADKYLKQIKVALVSGELTEAFQATFVLHKTDVPVLYWYDHNGLRTTIELDEGSELKAQIMRAPVTEETIKSRNFLQQLKHVTPKVSVIDPKKKKMVEDLLISRLNQKKIVFVSGELPMTFQTTFVLHQVSESAGELPVLYWYDDKKSATAIDLDEYPALKTELMKVPITKDTVFDRDFLEQLRQVKVPMINVMQRDKPNQLNLSNYAAVTLCFRHVEKAPIAGCSATPTP